MATLLSARERLLSIAQVLDAASADAGLPIQAYVTEDGDDVELGVRLLQLGVHPCDELRGTVAPADWWAMGVVTFGRARFLDHPDLDPEPIQSTYLLARDGTEVSLLRRGRDVEQLHGPAQGRIPDLCRSILGLL